LTNWLKGVILFLTVKQKERTVDKQQTLAALAIEILKTAELDDDSEQGVITVDPNLLFQFYILARTKQV
jgi:hypothetical protein